MAKQRKIKFTVIVKKWFDKVNGNTYHSVRCIRHKDAAVIVGPIQYGYGSAYEQTALEAMAEAKWLPVKYRNLMDNSWMLYERENNYPILWEVSDGLKRDCVANGIVQGLQARSGRTVWAYELNHNTI